MEKETSLYIHIPFCRGKCSYCAFPNAVGAEEYIDSYLDCLDWEALHYSGTRIKTLYIGGGTPTNLNSNQITRLFAIIKKYFILDECTERTIEANPETINHEKVYILRDMELNRISLGIQTLNEKYLEVLGRRHTRDDSYTSFQYIRLAGFENVNLDLMYSLPGQTQSEIADDVKKIITFNSEHLSLYTLDVEHGSKFYVQRMTLPDDTKRTEQYINVTRLLEKGGFNQYEISNFSKPGKESKHNIAYWEGGEYIGLGMGSHSYLDGKRHWNYSKLHLYMNSIKDRQMPKEGEEKLSAHERLLEVFLVNLRMNKGANISEFEERFGCRISKEKRTLLYQFIDDGFLMQDGPRIKTTLRGRLVLDDISSRLI